MFLNSCQSNLKASDIGAEERGEFATAPGNDFHHRNQYKDINTFKNTMFLLFMYFNILDGDTCHPEINTNTIKKHYVFTVPGNDFHHRNQFKYINTFKNTMFLLFVHLEMIFIIEINANTS